MRGQTTLDFVIGISVFLGVIFFIFLFAPGILTPFTVTGQSDAVTVDRTADYLAQDVLASPEEPYQLNRGCAVAFFDRDADEEPNRSDCRYDDAPLDEQLGLQPGQSANITILGNTTDGTQSEQLYWNDNTRELSESIGTELSIGDPVEQRRATTTATRVVTLNGQDVIMRVVVN